MHPLLSRQLFFIQVRAALGDIGCIGRPAAGELDHLALLRVVVLAVGRLVGGLSARCHGRRCSAVQCCTVPCRASERAVRGLALGGQEGEGVVGVSGK